MITPISLLDKLSQPHSEEAWHRFVDIYTPLLCHWARKTGIPANDTSDLLQEVFILLYRELPRFQSKRRGHFHGWLYRVFQNKSLEWLRKRQFHLVNGQALLHMSEVQELELDEEEYQKYLAERILHLLKGSFPETTWKACWESVVEDRPASEIAEQLGITVNMVYLAKSRVLRQLRHELQGLLENE